MSFKLLKTAALALAVAAAQPAAATDLFNFDGVAAGSPANSAVTPGISFAYAAFVAAVDANGDEIPGSETWQADASAGEVLVADPNSRVFGNAPSLPNALDAVDQPVLLLFAGAQPLNQYAVDAITFDNSTFGGAPTGTVLFLDAGHATIGQMLLTADGTGFSGLSAGIADVHALLLPSGAFYDNIAVTAVPVPAAVWLFGSALAGIGVFGRRKTAA